LLELALVERLTGLVGHFTQDDARVDLMSARDRGAAKDRAGVRRDVIPCMSLARTGPHDGAAPHLGIGIAVIEINGEEALLAGLIGRLGKDLTWLKRQSEAGLQCLRLRTWFGELD